MMIDIRDHGGAFGGGKYRKGSKIPFGALSDLQTVMNKVDDVETYAISVSPNGGYVALSKQSAPLIKVYDAKTRQLIRSINVIDSYERQRFCINDDGTIYYVFNTELVKLNADGTVAWRRNHAAIVGGFMPMPDGSVIITLGDAKTCIRYAPDGTTIFSRTATSNEYSSNVGVNRKGDAYTIYQSYYIAKLNTNTGVHAASIYVSAGIGDSPGGPIAVSPSGNRIATIHYNNQYLARLYKGDLSSSSYLASVVNYTGSFSTVKAFLMTSDYDLLEGQSGYAAAKRLDFTSNAWSDYAAGFTGSPVFIDMDLDGNVYCSGPNDEWRKYERFYTLLE
jgi:hypothetical protein